jgi:transmembrane sensor
MTERSVTEQATDWVVELADGGEQTRADFLNWLTESPRHVEEYLLASTLYKALDRVDTARQIDLSAALAEASFNVVSLKAAAIDSPQTAQASPVRRRRWSAIAAALVAACLLGVWWAIPKDRGNYSTGIGELRSIELADGSVVDLNTQSRIEVRFSEGARAIRLFTGEALFKVESDPTRPFVVYADKAVIRALGTQFNVYRRPRETAVSVIEGSVQISSNSPTPPVEKLIAGKSARISSSGEITQVASLDSVKVTAWRQRRLVFVDDTLADIVAEFNRYNSAPHLRVEGVYAHTRKLTGVFDAGDPQSLVQFLQNLGEFSVNATADEIVVRER